MKFGWLRNEISIDLLLMAERADVIGLHSDSAIRIAQKKVNKTWGKAQQAIDSGNNASMQTYCIEMAEKLSSWEDLSYTHAIGTGEDDELLYARGIDKTHAVLEILAKKLGISEGQKPPP